MEDSSLINNSTAKHKFCNIFVCNLLGEQKQKKEFWEELITQFTWYDTYRIENDMFNS
jgi:hypothetical protein